MKQRISCLVGALALAATLLSGCGAQSNQLAPTANLSDAGRSAASQARQATRAAGAETRGGLSLADWWRRAYAKARADAAAGGVERVLGNQPTAR